MADSDACCDESNEGGIFKIRSNCSTRRRSLSIMMNINARIAEHIAGNSIFAGEDLLAWESKNRKLILITVKINSSLMKFLFINDSL